MISLCYLPVVCIYCLQDESSTRSPKSVSSSSTSKKAPSQKIFGGSRAPTEELQQRLQQRLKKEEDSNALETFESKIKQNAQKRKDDDKRKQDSAKVSVIRNFIKEHVDIQNRYELRTNASSLPKITKGVFEFNFRV